MERAGYLAHARTAHFRGTVESSLAVIREALAGASRPYIAYSTGKDSAAMADMAWGVAPDIPAVYFDADCAFPESEELLARTAKAHTVIRWKCEPFFDTLRRMGGPTADGIENETMRTTVYRPIKALLAEYRFDCVFVGLRAEEAKGRMLLGRNRGQLFFNKRDGIMECLPMMEWHFDDIWTYLVGRGVDYNAAYDAMDGMPLSERRVSYWAGETDRNRGRWAWLRKRYPELYNRYISEFPEVAAYT